MPKKKKAAPSGRRVSDTELDELRRYLGLIRDRCDLIWAITRSNRVKVQSGTITAYVEIMERKLEGQRGK